MIEDRKEGLRYLMSEKEVTKANVEKFLADFKEGKLEPFLKRYVIDDVHDASNGAQQSTQVIPQEACSRSQ